MKYEGCTILVHLYIIIIIGLNNSHGSYSGFNHFRADKVEASTLHVGGLACGLSSQIIISH